MKNLFLLLSILIITTTACSNDEYGTATDLPSTSSDTSILRKSATDASTTFIKNISEGKWITTTQNTLTITGNDFVIVNDAGLQITGSFLDKRHGYHSNNGTSFSYMNTFGNVGSRVNVSITMEIKGDTLNMSLYIQHEGAPSYQPFQIGTLTYTRER